MNGGVSANVRSPAAFSNLPAASANFSAPRSNGSNVTAKTVGIWENTLKNKTSTLKNAFGVCVLIAVISLTAVLAFAKYELKDVPLVLLLLMSLISTIPYIEVAVPEKNSLQRKHVTVDNWRQRLGTNDKYTILSSSLHFLQPMYAMFCVLSFILFAVHKIFGSSYVTHKFVLLILVIQLPFNPLAGFNPFATFMIRQHTAKHITQENLSTYLRNNTTNNQKKRINAFGTRIPLTAFSPEASTTSTSTNANSRRLASLGQPEPAVAQVPLR